MKLKSLLPLVCMFAILCALVGAQDKPPAPPTQAEAAPATASAPASGAPANAAGAPATAAETRQQKQVKEAGKRFAAGWGEKLKHGGWAAVVQLLVSAFGAGFVFERFVNLRRNKICPRGLSARVRQLWREGKMGEIEALAQKDGSTLARVIAYVVQHRNNSFADVSVAAGDLAAAELSEHYERAYPLGIVATLEPLLGLLGMILGMIQTFEIVAMAGALGDPSQLASGISEALVTTGLGLAIAIPFLALYHIFKSRTTKFGTMLEKEVTALTSEWLLKQEAPSAS